MWEKERKVVEKERGKKINIITLLGCTFWVDDLDLVWLDYHLFWARLAFPAFTQEGTKK